MYPGAHMTTVIEPKTIEDYQAKVKELATKNNTSAILSLIEDHQQQYHDVTELEAFFKGEHAFYSENYEKALVHYMQARQIEEFEFYCYRATAFVSFMRKNVEKASSFVEKALSIKPEDLPTLSLKHDILVRQEEYDQASVIKSHLDTQEISAEPPKEEPVVEPEPTPPVQTAPEPSSDFIASKLGVDVEAEQELEQRMQAHRQTIQAVVRDYIDKGPRVHTSQDDALWVLNGWDLPKERDVIPHLPSKAGGFFLRWNGHGVVVNPGKGFLERFHEAGLHLQMIDSVIVTEPHVDAHEDIQNIYDLNYELNKVGTELHIIRYFLNHNAHQRLSHTLKPNFKQERNTVHSLELFLDSPDIEKEQITDEITLNYFSTGSRSSLSGNEKAHALAIWLEMSKGAEVKKVGFVTGAGWSQTLGTHFGSLDLLVSSFGSTEPNDYGKLNYLEKELGYFGTYTLLEEVKPTLHLVSGFDGKQGDIRLEVLKKLRKEYTKNHQIAPNMPVVLPADKGMRVELNQMKIQSSVTKEMLDPKNVQICKTQDAFGVLRYISQDSIL